MSAKMTRDWIKGNEIDAIKRVLRRRGSQEYFNGGGWTADPHEASSFADMAEAAEVCARYGLDHVALVLRFDSADSDVFRIPIR